MYFLDTNTLIYFFKGLGKIADRLFDRSPEDIGIPAVVLFELETGIAKSAFPEKRTVQLRELLASVSVIPFGIQEARHSARIRSRLEKVGMPIGPLDTLIAGTTVANSATLVTRNTREFARVQELRVENWFS